MLDHEGGNEIRRAFPFGPLWDDGTVPFISIYAISEVNLKTTLRWANAIKYDKMRAVQHVYLVQIPHHLLSPAPNVTSAPSPPSFMAQHWAEPSGWMSQQRVKETMGCVTAEELQKGLVLLNSIHEGTLSKDAAKWYFGIWERREKTLMLDISSGYHGFSIQGSRDQASPWIPQKTWLSRLVNPERHVVE